MVKKHVSAKQYSSKEVKGSLHSLCEGIFGRTIPEFEIHLPLDADPENVYAPTAKTGVALGLLRLCPGETLKVINHATQENTDSPFQYFVGHLDAILYKSLFIMDMNINNG